MSTTRECQQGINRTRQTNLLRSRQERALYARRLNQRAVSEVFDSLEHDRRVEEELIEGSWNEQEAARDANNRY